LRFVFTQPKDKLDAATMVVVNGPKDATLDRRDIDWRACEATVRRLRQRIFTASRAGDLKRVRNLQKLMLRSRANTLVSVRRATERNTGRLTAGVDGEVCSLPGPGQSWPTGCSTMSSRSRPSPSGGCTSQAGQPEAAPARDSRDR
jgi:N-terminal domain of reverse transcriptase